MYCKKCGTDAGDNAFCIRCGAKIEAGTEITNESALVTSANTATKVSASKAVDVSLTKGKLGISVELLAAAVFFMLLFGGYVPALLLLGYIWIKEEDMWLKKTAVKAFAICIVLSALATVFQIWPDCLSWVDSIVNVFSGNFKYGTFSSIIAVFTKAISIVKTVAMLILGFLALSHRTIAIDFIDKLVEKHC